MNYLIGIDLGTSSTKTVLFDEDGNVIASAGKDYPLYTPTTGGQSRNLRTGAMLPLKITQN